MVRRSTIIEPNTEVIVPVTVHKRSCNLSPTSQLGVQLLQACLTSHLQQKGLHAETVVALANITLLELYEENNEGVVGQARVINQHVSHEQVEKTLSEPVTKNSIA